jgi:hypothetical protein
MYMLCKREVPIGWNLMKSGPETTDRPSTTYNINYLEQILNLNQPPLLGVDYGLFGFIIY